MRVRFPPGALKYELTQHVNTILWNDLLEENMSNIPNEIKKTATKENIMSYIHLHKQYFVSAAVLIVIIVALIFGANAIDTKKHENDIVSGDEYEPAENFDVNAYPELNELITKYFNAYINADIATLETIVSPLTDMEKSYLTEMSKHYEEYRNIVVYSKQGLSRDSYIVSASFDIKFYEKEELAPSMMLFYVQTKEDGSLYIDNLYSDFNLRYSELEVNTDIYTALIKYTTETDYRELYSQVESSYNALIKENNDIYQLTKREIPAARQRWEESVYYASSTEQGTESTQQSTENVTDTQVTEETTQAESQAPAVQKVQATANDVNIRSSANTSSEVLGKMNVGDVFVKISVEGEWTKIEYNGGTGFIKNEFLTDVTE